MPGLGSYLILQLSRFPMCSQKLNIGKTRSDFRESGASFRFGLTVRCGRSSSSGASASGPSCSGQVAPQFISSLQRKTTNPVIPADIGGDADLAALSASWRGGTGTRTTEALRRRHLPPASSIRGNQCILKRLRPLMSTAMKIRHRYV